MCYYEINSIEQVEVKSQIKKVIVKDAITYIEDFKGNFVPQSDFFYIDNKKCDKYHGGNGQREFKISKNVRDFINKQIEKEV